jgi:lipoate-protein ligase B
VKFLGRVRYGDGLRIQRDLVVRRIADEIPDTLLLLEHEPVVTLGRVARAEHVLVDRERLAQMGVEIHDTDRGGDVTYHGPGQVVGYPIVDLNGLRRDVKWYLEQLEEVMIRTCARYGVEAARRPGMTGAWVGSEKIGAIGVRVERWVTSHGFAFNVATDLRSFGLIVPCGLQGEGVTSLSALLGRAVELERVTRDVAETFGAVFQRELRHEAAAP